MLKPALIKKYNKKEGLNVQQTEPDDSLPEKMSDP